MYWDSIVKKNVHLRESMHVFLTIWKPTCQPLSSSCKSFIYFCFQIIGWDNEEYSDVCRPSEFVTYDDIQYRFLSHLTPTIKTVNLYSKATNLWGKRLFKIKVQNIFMKNALSSFDMKLIFFISNFMSLLRFLNCHFSYLTERPVI